MVPKRIDLGYFLLLFFFGRVGFRLQVFKTEPADVTIFGVEEIKGALGGDAAFWVEGYDAVGVWEKMNCCSPLLAGWIHVEDSGGRGSDLRE